jgi:N-methylhydantoinase A
VHFGKTPSTPEDQSIGVMTGLSMMAERLSMTTAEMLGQTERVVHGMTVATNALLERKGARLGLLTTEGHRDILEMREGLKPERYNLRLPRYPALAPRHLRLGVRERMRDTGAVEIALDGDSLDAAIETLRAAKVEAVAVCYLHSYANPDHEHETRDKLLAAMPDVYVSLSCEVLPQIKEFERVSTTAVNAYVGPALDRYLGGLERSLRREGYQGPALIILSHGGVAPIAEAIRLAAGTVLSGPAGGLAGARHASGVLGAANLIPFDMGGTSTDISLIVEGQAALSSDRVIAGERVALSSLDIVTLGAGGGSIAWVDAGGLLRVGPHSAGAAPGPACYGKGGGEPTVTDANVVLGYLDPISFGAGGGALDAAAATSALDRLGGALGIDGVAAAEGVFRVVNTQMAEGVRLATVRRGVDPRQFALFGFGGAAGLHLTALAQVLDLKRVIVPRMASVLSAWGILTSDLRYEVSRTQIGEIDAKSPAALKLLYGELESEAKGALSGWFDGAIETSRSAEMRYGEQIFEIDVDLNNIDFDDDDAANAIKRAFEARHVELYTYALPDREPVLVNARVAATGALSAPLTEPLLPAGPMPAPTGTRAIYLGEWLDAPIYAFDALPPGGYVEGPALIVSQTTTVLLQPGDSAIVTPTGWLDIAVDEER